ncbi:MAG: HIT family protein [Nanoarchaeota archaeon]|nr:HIT family protein [Nanoarchaeota archaeon]
MECVFCKIYKENKDVIYENKYFFAQFDKFPVSPGHAEIIPKRHVASLFELSDEEWKYLKSALVDVKEIIEKSDLKKVYEGFLKKSN